MRQISRFIVTMIVLSTGVTVGQVQVAANSLGVGTQTAGQAVVAPDARTEKQKALAEKTERLFEMATELKLQVDKTNKNILSLKVVQKAEEIETLAKGMRGQVKE